MKPGSPTPARSRTRPSLSPRPPGGERASRSRILGQLLLETAGISKEDLDDALAAQTGTGERLGRVLVDRGLVDEEALARALALQLNLPYAPPPLEPGAECSDVLPREFLRTRRVALLERTPRSVRLAMADPLDLATVDDVQFRLGRRVDPVVASPPAVLEALEGRMEAELARLVADLPPAEGARTRDDPDALERAARAAPVVRLVDHLLREAAAGRASDIHIEDDGGRLRVRYRIDGVLEEITELPPGIQGPVLSRIKIVAGMDISVKRRPQDGGLTFRHGARQLRLRVSTLPAGGSEKAVIRILDPRRAPSGLDDLGLSRRDLSTLRRLLRAGQGVILAAGPTGSGKTSTLVGALAELDRTRQNVVTLEDPVEYSLPGVSQVQVEPRAGLTFPAALRSVLRQDPDVVMVGEIRDRETAEIAMAAAVTGHLVLSTIHTTDAPGAVTRLLHMGVPPYLVAGGLAGVVAQRLVRTLCDRCRARSGGCDRCIEGYRGRTGVFQVLVMTEAIREEVVGAASSADLRRLAGAGGMGSLADDARRKVAEGATTPHEVGRVIQADPGAALPCRGCGAGVPAGAAGCPACGRPRVRVCRCGRELRPEWRYCPGCLAKAPPA